MATEGDNKLTRDERRFAEQVRLLREERGMSQSDLADELRSMGLEYVTQATISRIENMARPVRMMESQALSRVFDRTVASMISPNGTEYLLATSAANHKAARKAFVEFRLAATAVAQAREVVRRDLERLNERLDNRSEFDPATKRAVEQSEEQMRQFVDLDLHEYLDEAIAGRGISRG